MAPMRNPGPLLLRLGLLTAALYLVAHLLGWPGLALVCKPLPVVCLLGFLIPPRTRDAALIATGLLLSAIGDLLLAGLAERSSCPAWSPSCSRTSAT
jgi:uncharacterized membrane protein YhhN